MKIVIDARLWSQTGVGRYIQELVKNLGEIDKENQYVIFANDDFGSQLPATSYQLLTTNIRWHSLIEQLLMPWVLWKEHLDLVHFPYFSVPIFYPGKFVVTIHDLILDHFDTGKASTLLWIFYKLKRLGYKLVMYITLHRAEKIITVSKATKKEIIEHYGIRPGKIVVTYESAGENTQGVLSETPLRCTGTKYLLYVGNAYPHKNLERMLEAISNLKSQISNLKLILVGPDDYFYREIKNRVKQMGLENNVMFYGPASREELEGLYKNALALVFPSLMEGFGLPGLEAMAKGCPVVCSDIPVFHEIYGEAAIYFNPNYTSDICFKLKAICYDDLNHHNIMIKKGLEQVKKYSWENLAKETLEIYNELFKK